MTGPLDALLAIPRRGCAVCGEQVRAHVAIRIYEIDTSTGRALKGGRGKSKSRSFCEEHAVETWRRATATLGERQ